MISLTRLLKIRNRQDSERGLTLPELLVAMGLLVLVAGVALAILLSTTSSSTRFGQNTANQTEVANAINIINRDISAASSVAYASNTAMTLVSNEDNVRYTVKVFGYDPSKADKGLPQNFTVNTGNLPTFSAIIEQRQAQNSATITQNVLVPGWKSDNQSTPLFTYYDKSDSQLQPPSAGNASLVDADIGNIKRIEFFISAKVSDRASSIELAGSAVPNTAGVQGLQFTQEFPPVPVAPTLSGTLAEGERVAHLSWVVSAGATSYTLYRKVNGGAYEVRAIISDPDTRTFDDSQNIDWGNIYTYYIVAFGSGGASANSNEVPLTVVPDKVNIVNINTRAQLNDVYPGLSSTSNPVAGYTYTVARNLTNQITWQPVNGATGYYVFKDGSTTPMVGTPVSADIHSIQDSNVSYGDNHSYTVQAFNQGANCIVTTIYPQANVCDGKVSDSVSLISPPTAPIIRADNTQVQNRDASPYNDIYLDGLSSSPSISGYRLYRSGVGGAKPNCDAVTDTGQQLPAQRGSKTSNYVSWNEGDCYRALAYNDAGDGPLSVPTLAAVTYQSSSSFGFQNVDSKQGLDSFANGSRYTVARGNTNQLSWNESYGAEGYEIYRDGNYVTAVSGGTRYWRDENVPNGDKHTYFVRATVDWNENAALSDLHDPYLRDRDGGNTKRKNIDSGSVQLISPPTAPQISAVANDDSTESKSTNYVYVNNYGTNTATVTVYRAQQAASNPQCTTDNTLTNNAGGTNGDGNADWGSSTCYVARAYNDAGSSSLSNTATADQLPGKFKFNFWENTRDYLATYAEGFSSLDNASNNNNDGATSKRNQSLSYTLKWENSLGSKRYNLLYGYKNDNNSTRNDWSSDGRGTCGSANVGIVNALMPTSAVDNSKCFIDDNPVVTSTAYSNSNLAPGSYYRAVTIAVGNNNTRRGASTEFATTPTIPKFTSVYSYKRQVDNAGPSSSGTSYMAKVANVSLATTFGSATSIRAYYDWNDNALSELSTVGNPTWYSRSAAQGTNEYLTLNTGGHKGTETSYNRNTTNCKQVSLNYCDIFNTDYDSNGNANTTRGDLTERYNTNRRSAYTTNSGPPPRYQWGNGDTIHATGGAQTYLSASKYNYYGYSDQIQWQGGISESNCYYLACNPDNTDVTSGSNSGPWAGYSYNEYVPNGMANHGYYFMSGAQGTSPSSTTQGNPPAAATRTYATGSASTSSGALPANNVASND